MNAAPEPEFDWKDRYSRQILLGQIGLEGQQRLMAARVLLVGCGALGTAIADMLVRAGVGFLRICDRDYLELNNLQRQVLFDEQDVGSDLPKAEAARRKLVRIHSGIEIEAVVADVNPTNIERLASGCDLLLDGTDNFETRYLINDVSIKHSIAWVYGAVIGTTGLCMPIIPGQTPCLRCVFESPPPAELSPTCDTAGVLAPAVAVVAAFQCTEAFKILTGQLDALSRGLTNIDVWTGRVVRMNTESTEQADPCPCCKSKNFEYLDGASASMTSQLCGRDAVQINTPGNDKIDFENLASKLESTSCGSVTHNRFLLRAIIEGHQVTVFGDGRAIIKGTTDTDRARTLYARYIGI